jgi:hypothetical protein
MQQSKRIWVTSEPCDNGQISHLERLDISNISFKDMHVCSAQFGEFLGVCLAANECKDCILRIQAQLTNEFELCTSIPREILSATEITYPDTTSCAGNHI